MTLTLLCAGCSSGEREQAEADVRAAMAHRPAAEAWTVSLVKIGGRWSVTLDGPGYRAVSLVAEAGRLRKSLSEVLGESPQPSAPAASSTGTSATFLARDRHRCGSCGRPFEVLYETAPDEAQEMAAVACPHCWAKTTVLVGESAAYTRAFRAEKIEP